MGKSKAKFEDSAVKAVLAMGFWASDSEEEQQEELGVEDKADIPIWDGDMARTLQSLSGCGEGKEGDGLVSQVVDAQIVQEFWGDEEELVQSLTRSG